MSLSEARLIPCDFKNLRILVESITPLFSSSKPTHMLNIFSCIFDGTVFDLMRSCLQKTSPPSFRACNVDYIWGEGKIHRISVLRNREAK